MDDIALSVGFAVLLDASVAPLWFVAGLATSRVLFSLVRKIGLVRGSEFAKPQVFTKLSGMCLAIGQCLLLANIDNAHQASIDITIGVMSAVLCLSMYTLLVNQHGAILIGLLKNGHQN